MNQPLHKKLRVLVACEYSGTVRDAFLAAGHEAMSCDLLPTEKPGPHYQGSVLDVLNEGWDLMIAHPPCTMLSKAGARWMYAGGALSQQRLKAASLARDFFYQLLEAPIPRKCIENPEPLSIVSLPAHSQVVQPYEFGHPHSKRTLLWLRGLPHLVPTQMVPRYTPYLPSNTGGAARGQKATPTAIHSQADRSRTFPGIAAAMAAQWGDTDRLARLATQTAFAFAL